MMRQPKIRAKHVNDGVVLALLMFHAMVLAAATNPDLGLSHQALAWLGVLDVGAGVLLNRLQTIGGQP